LTGSADGYLAGLTDGSAASSPVPLAGGIIGLFGAAACLGARRR
jgi:hypothetical protein